MRRKSNKATGRDYTYDKQYQKQPRIRKYQAALHRYNRKKGKYGLNDGLDASHKNGRIVGYEKASTNRARKTDFTNGTRKARRSK